MTDIEQTPEPQPLEHAYSVTHYVRPAGNIGGWQQITSAEHTAEEAIAWIRQHVSGSRDAALGLAAAAPEALPAAPESEDLGAPAEPPAEASAPGEPEAEPQP